MKQEKEWVIWEHIEAAMKQKLKLSDNEKMSRDGRDFLDTIAIQERKMKTRSSSSAIKIPPISDGTP